MQEKLLETITRTKTINAEKGILSPTILRDVRNGWYWFIITPVLFITTACTYLRYATPQYVVKASILIRDDSRGGDFGDATVLESLGLATAQSSVDNEVEVLKSRTLMESVVNDLQLFIRCYASGNLKTTELYEKSPITIRLINPDLASFVSPATYLLTFYNEDKYKLSNTTTNIHGMFGDTILLPAGRAVLQKTKWKPSRDDIYSIKISDKNQITDEYAAALKVQPANKLVSIVNISLTDAMPLKAEVVLNRLIENYLRASVGDKNRTADSTIAFIKDNLQLVSGELTELELRIEKFQRLNQIIGHEDYTKNLLETSAQLTADQRHYAVQLSILQSIEKYISEFPGHAVPSSLFIQDPHFLTLVRNYNELYLSLKKADATISAAHPSSQTVKSEIRTVRESLNESILSQKQELRTAIAALYQFEDTLQKQKDQIPAQKRIILDYSRQQQIKQDLYTFLLKKQVETSVSRSSTFANARIIDKPMSDREPIYPKRRLYLLLAGIMGFGFPLAIIYLRETLNTLVQTRTDITSRTKVPVLAEIGHYSKHSISVFQPGGKSHIAEQFRVLRTHIQLLPAHEKNHVILLTSSIGGEGKSFIAVNLCHALALSGKRTLLIELDLRKPKIANYLNLKSGGVTDCLTFDRSIPSIIQPSGLHKHFDVISSGPLPADPAELLCEENAGKMISEMKVLYDFIILDTPPIGLVTDASLIAHHADICLYVVRERFTPKYQLEAIQEISGRNLLPGMQLIINDLKPVSACDYGYYNERQTSLKQFFKAILLIRQT